EVGAPVEAISRERPWVAWVRRHIGRVAANAVADFLPDVLAREALIDNRRERFWDHQPVEWRTVGGLRVVHRHTKEGRVAQISVLDPDGKRQAQLRYQHDEFGLTRAMDSEMPMKSWALTQTRYR